LAIVCVSLAILGLLGTVWQIIDAFFLNGELLYLGSVALSSNKLYTAFALFLASSCVSIICACVGHGARSGSSRAIICSVVGTTLLLGGFTATGILAYKLRSKHIGGLRWGLGRAIVNEPYAVKGPLTEPTHYTKFGRAFNFLQVTRHCCGNERPGGWEFAEANYSQRYHFMFPYACCTLHEGADPRAPQRQDVVDVDACFRHTTDFYHNEACVVTEYDWLSYKLNFLLGYNFILGVFLLAFAVLLVLIACLT
jgi:hypothetical protein